MTKNSLNAIFLTPEPHLHSVPHLQLSHLPPSYLSSNDYLQEIHLPIVSEKLTTLTKIIKKIKIQLLN